MHVTDEENEEVSFKTRRHGLRIFRDPFKTAGDKVTYTHQWYYMQMVAGKRARFPLGVTKRTAEKTADEIYAFLSIPTNTLDMAIAKYNPRKLARFSDCPTVGEILEVYKKALNAIGIKGHAVKEATFNGYKSGLLTLMRKVEAYRKGTEFESFMGKRNIDFSPWLNQRIDIFTARYAIDFKLSSPPPPPPLEEEPDLDEALTAKISADTTLRCARAIFSKTALRYYKEIGLKLPDLTPFMSEPDFGAVKYFQLLPPDVIVNIARQSIALRNDNLDAFRAFMLCMHCGLRHGEALAFEDSWLRLEDRPMLYVTLGGTFSPKHGHGRKVVIEQWVYDALKESGPVQNPASMVLLNKWLKNLVPAEFAVNKAIHELRKCWVSYKAKAEGILAASQQAGHREIKTTSTYYADNMMADRLLPLWQEPTEAAILKFTAA